MRGLRILSVFALLIAFVACGGSRHEARSRSDQSGDAMGEGGAVASRTLLTFDWTGGFAGFMRHLEVDSDGLARAKDRRRNQARELRLSEGRLDSLMTLLGERVTESAGPFSSRVIDDFHFTLVLTRAGDKSIRVEGNGSALPDSMRPVFRELEQLTGEVLSQARDAGDQESK